MKKRVNILYKRKMTADLMTDCYVLPNSISKMIEKVGILND